MTLHAPSPDEAIWRRPDRPRGRSTPDTWRLPPRLRRRFSAALAHPISLFSAACGLWVAPGVVVSGLDLPRAIAAVVRVIESRPLQASLGFAAAALYAIAPGLLLASASRRLARGWRPGARAVLYVVVAPAVFVSLVAWTALAAGCFFAAMLWVHGLWP